MPDLKRERNLISLVMKLLSREIDFQIEDVYYPEDQKPTPVNPVDAVYRTTGGFYILEHTKIESYDTQITEDFKIADLLSLETELESKTPITGKFDLVFHPRATSQLKINAKNLKKISDWVQAIATKLDVGNPSTAPKHKYCEYLPEFDLELCLYRWPSDKTQFKIARYSPEDTEKELLAKVHQSLQNKLPKLSSWSKSHNGFGILILESVDIALVNCSTIAEACFAALPFCKIKPDLIFIAQAHRNKCELWKLGQPFESDNSEFKGYYDV